MAMIETQNRRQKKNLEVKILPFPGLVKSGSEQPGPGATLLGWPKSIYYCSVDFHFLALIRSYHNTNCDAICYDL